MNTYSQVNNMITDWKSKGIIEADLCMKIAEACIGWPYVFGGSGQKCTAANRLSYANRSTCPAAESAVIKSLCQSISSGKNCDGCKWYPGGATLFYDCRGFTRWLLQQAYGWTLQGGGATAQWNTSSNWKQKGVVADIPNQLCVVFWQNGSKMSHTGMYIGNGWVIHCSGTVKKEQLSKLKVTHWAIPVCMSGDAPVPTPTPTPSTDKPTLRRGSSGEYVTLLQTKLIQMGYDCGQTGADGKYGDKTVAAVKAFQRDAGLTVDGVCGKNTWAALDSGKVTFYTVTIQHVSKSVADGLITQYGGSMKAEG